MTQFSIRNDATCGEVVLDVVAALVNFKKRSVIITTKWLQFKGFRSGLSMSVGTSPIGPPPEIFVKRVDVYHLDCFVHTGTSH